MGGPKPVRVLGTRTWLFMVGQSPLENSRVLGSLPSLFQILWQAQARGQGSIAVAQRTARAFVQQKPAHRAGVHRRAATREAQSRPGYARSQNRQGQSDHEVCKAMRAKLLIAPRNTGPRQERSASHKGPHPTSSTKAQSSARRQGAQP